MSRKKYAIYDYSPRCSHCGLKKMSSFLHNGKYVCWSCNEEIKELEQIKENQNKGAIHGRHVLA